MDNWLQQLIATALSYATLAAIAMVAFAGLYTFAPNVRRRLLPLPRLQPGWWTGLDVLLAFLASQLIPLVIFMTLLGVGFFPILIGPAPGQETPEFQEYVNRSMNLASPLILTVILAVAFAFFFVRRGLRPRHFGFSWARWSANLAVALLVFILATPLVYLIYLLTTLIFPAKDHALAQLGKQSIESWEWVLLAFQATVAAPILEEFVFRGILLGWLRRASLRGHVTICLLTVFVAIDRGMGKADSWDYVWPILFAICLVLGYGYALIRMVRRFGLSDNEVREWRVLPSEMCGVVDSANSADDGFMQRQTRRLQDEVRSQLWSEANADLAILGAAMLFAVVHSSNWPAPMPLMLLGLALGWMARRTQNLLGPIIVHALFNLVAFIALYCTVAAGPAAIGNAQTTPVRPSPVGSITTSVPASQLPLRK